MNRRELELAALATADRCLKARGYIALDEVFRELGKLEPRHWEDWRFGRVPYLERVIRLNLNQINAVCCAVQAHARRGSLNPSWTAYFKWGKGARTPLRFTKSGDPRLERAWSTRYVCAQSGSVRTDASPTPAADILGGADFAVSPDTDSARAAHPVERTADRPKQVLPPVRTVGQLLATAEGAKRKPFLKQLTAGGLH